MDQSEDYSRYIGMTSEPSLCHAPLESDTLRRFVQAVMDDDPLYFDEGYASQTRHGGIVAPPLYPVHAFKRLPGSPDPLDLVKNNPDADGAGGIWDKLGLPPIESPFKRLLNGGSEIEFFQCLKLGERVYTTSRYHDVRLKEGKTGQMLLVTIETELRNDRQELLLINRQTLIWR